MTTKFNTRKLISNFILFENLKINNFFLLSIFHKRTVLRNLVSITATSFCLKFTLALRAVARSASHVAASSQARGRPHWNAAWPQPCRRGLLP